MNLHLMRPVFMIVCLMSLVLGAVACSGGGSDGAAPAAPVVPTKQPVAGKMGNITSPATPAPAQVEPAKVAAVAASGPKTERVMLALQKPPAFSNDLAAFGSTSAFQLKPMYEYMIDTDPNTRNLIPGLAKSWQVEPSGSGLRFFLNKDVPFNGGQGGTMTADDVLWTWEDQTREDSIMSFRSLFRRAKLEVINDYELTLTWPTPDADSLDGIANQVGGMEVSSRADAETLGRKGLLDRPIAGTGPYEFVSRTQESNIVYRKADTPHWRVTPDFQEIEIRWISENSTRMAALLAGEVHITNIGFDQEQHAINAGMEVVSGKVNTMRTYMQMKGVYIKDSKDFTKGFKYPDNPLSEHKVRKALNKAINRDAINTAYFYDMATVMKMTHVAETHGAWNPRWGEQFDDQYGFDPAAARTLLKEAGYDYNNPLETNLFVYEVAQYTGGPDVALTIGAMWADIGVKVKFTEWDAAKRRAVGRKLEMNNMIGLGVLIAPPILALRLNHHTSPPRGGSVENLAVEPIFQTAREQLDLKKQNEYLSAAADIIYDEHLSIPLFWVPVHVMVNPEVVDDWIFPGTVSGTYTHMWNIIGVR